MATTNGTGLKMRPATHQTQSIAKPLMQLLNHNSVPPGDLGESNLNDPTPEYVREMLSKVSWTKAIIKTELLMQKGRNPETWNSD